MIRRTGIIKKYYIVRFDRQQMRLSVAEAVYMCTLYNIIIIYKCTLTCLLYTNTDVHTERGNLRGYRAYGAECHTANVHTVHGENKIRAAYFKWTRAACNRCSLGVNENKRREFCWKSVYAWLTYLAYDDITECLNNTINADPKNKISEILRTFEKEKPIHVVLSGFFFFKYII